MSPTQPPSGAGDNTGAPSADPVTEPLVIEDPTIAYTPTKPPGAYPETTAGAYPGMETFDDTAVMAPVPPLPPAAPAGPPAASADTAALPAIPAVADKPWRWLGKLVYWGFVGWILAYCGVLLSAFGVQFLQGEFPCPLCMLQRYAMMLSSLAALWIVMQARRGTLTTGRYGQALGLGLLASLIGGTISTRQILLHILPGDPGYGSAVLGLHLYTWALITFVIVIAFCAVALLLMPRALPTAPGDSWLGKVGRFLTLVVVWLFLIVLVANVIAIIFLEGAAWVLPDDPTSYNLLDQIGLGGN